MSWWGWIAVAAVFCMNMTATLNEDHYENTARLYVDLLFIWMLWWSAWQ